MEDLTWDLFIAHTGPDEPVAEELYSVVAPHARVFLDSRCLLLGDNWDAEIAAAQRRSLVTVVLISSNSVDAYYQREEIAAAIVMARQDSTRHRVVPVFLHLDAADSSYVPYGLHLKHGLTLSRQFTMMNVAGALLDLVSKLGSGTGGLQPPTTRDAILLTRIINPPKGEHGQQSTVWLVNRGNLSYIIDAITIAHSKGLLCSMGSGAILPDADYRFTFEYGSYETVALNPALALSQEDRRPVSFTLALGPSGTFPQIGGTVAATLHYQTTDGEVGTLELKEPDATAKFLAELVHRDVEVGGMVVTPTGVQRGRFDKESNDTRIVYAPLELPWLDLDCDDELPVPAPKIDLTAGRIALNKAIAAENVLPQITKRLRSLDSTAFDLVTGLSEADMSALLFELGLEPRYAKASLHALAVRHYLWPSEALATFILDRRIADGQLAYSSPYIEKKMDNSTLMVADERLSWSANAAEEAGGALILYPAGSWEEALIRLLRNGVNVWTFLYLRRSQLKGEHRSAIKKICRSELIKRFPEEVARRFCSWLDSCPRDN
jgi:hypothetical protein